MEKEIEVKVFRIKFKCPKCETGYLKQCKSSKHMIMQRADDGYEHRCDNKDCRYEQELERIYPYLKYKETNQEQYD